MRNGLSNLITIIFAKKLSKNNYLKKIFRINRMEKAITGLAIKFARS